MEEKQRRIRENPLKYAKQHTKQEEATKAPSPIRALFWGNRTGKTEWGGQEAARFSTGSHPFRKVIVPNEGWAACPSFDLQIESVQPKIEKYLGSNDIAHVDYLRSNIWKSVRLRNGSLITFKSYEQGAEKFQSAGKRWIWFDEEPPSDIYEECVVRQEAGLPLDIFITMTPVNGMTWIYDDIYLDTGNPLYYISEAEWNDNPWLLTEQKEQMRSALSKRGERIEVREKGKFMSQVGLVCSWWRREKHLRSYTELPKDWAYYEMFDGGWSDPATWLLLGFDPIGNLHIVDGFAEKELLTEEIKKKRDSRVGGLLIRGGWADNDNPRLSQELGNAGMSLAAVEKKPGESKSWDETMSEAMASYGKVQKGTGEPQIYVNKDLTWLVQQIENLKWLEVGKREDKEVRPVWNDHRKFGHHFDGIFCLGYFAVSYRKQEKQIPTYQWPDQNVWRIGR